MVAGSKGWLLRMLVPAGWKQFWSSSKVTNIRVNTHDYIYPEKSLKKVKKFKKNQQNIKSTNLSQIKTCNKSKKTENRRKKNPRFFQGRSLTRICVLTHINFFWIIFYSFFFWFFFGFLQFNVWIRFVFVIFSWILLFFFEIFRAFF